MYFSNNKNCVLILSEVSQFTVYQASKQEERVKC